MYQEVLVPMALDHGESPQLLKIATTLKAKGGEIIARHVHEAARGSVRTYLDDVTVKEGFEYARQKLEDKVRDIGDIATEIVSGHIARAMIDYANEKANDCIVTGSHKPGLSDYFLGSTASRVVRHAACAEHLHRNS